MSGFVEATGYPVFGNDVWEHATTSSTRTAARISRRLVEHAQLDAINERYHNGRMSMSG
jgi:hypothetical protein